MSLSPIQGGWLLGGRLSTRNVIGRLGIDRKPSAGRWMATESDVPEGPFLKPKTLGNWDAKEMPHYMDAQATTPVDPRVLEKMLPTFCVKFGNAHSRTHAYGWQAEGLVEEGRREVARLINCDPKEIVMTSGATESNNLALKGVAQFYGRRFAEEAGVKVPHLVTVQTEHKCVLATAQYLANECGWDVTFLPVDSEGLVDLATLRASIRPETALVSVMTVNNEIGVIQPIKQIVETVRAVNRKTLVHTDAAQAVGKIPVDVRELGVDLMSISAHKMYGPKGVGALFVRHKGPRQRVRLTPQIHGGGQENGLRSGTAPVPLIVGFGEAARLCREELDRNLAHVERLAARFLQKVSSRLSGVKVNGHPEKRFPGNLNVSFDCVEGESLIMAMDRVAVSSGSACTSASLEPSYVLRAIGVDEELAHTSLRFGFTKDTTEEQVDQVAELVIEAVEKLRSLSPLWEMKQNGEKDEMTWT